MLKRSEAGRKIAADGRQALVLQTLNKTTAGGGASLDNAPLQRNNR